MAAAAQATKLLREIEDDIENTYKRIEEDATYYALKGRLQKLRVVLNNPERENDAPKTRPNTLQTPPKRAGPKPAEAPGRSAASLATSPEASNSEREAPGLEESKWSTVERKKPRATPKVPTIDLTRGTPTYSQVAAKPAPA